MTLVSARTRLSPLLTIALVTAFGCLALALIPTQAYAETFAHPARVAKLDGVIPNATMRGAEFFRIALAISVVALPLLAWLLERCCPQSATRSARRMMPTRRWQWIGLIIIIGFGAFLRFVLAQQSLWYDEISAFLSFAIEGPGVAFGSYAVPTNHVPQTLATWLVWNMTASTSNVALRLPAILAGIAAIPVAHALAATLWGRRAGLLAPMLVACAPIPLLESAEARGYSFVILTALVAALALARAQRTHRSTDYAVFAIACACAAWSHPVSIVLPIAAALVGLWRDRALVIASIIAGVLALVLLSPLLGDVLASRNDYIQSLNDQPTLFSREGYEAFVGLTLSWSGRWRLPEIILALLALVGAKHILRRMKVPSHIRAVLLPFALAFALAMVISALLGTWIYARFFLFALPIGVLVVTSGLMCVRELTRIVPYILIVCALSDSALLFTPKQPIEDAVQIVAAQRKTTDVVATIGLPDNAVGFYTQQQGFAALSTGFLGHDLAATISAHHPRFIVVLYPDRLASDTHAMLEASYERTDRLEGWADWGHGAVEIWKSR